MHSPVCRIFNSFLKEKNRIRQPAISKQGFLFCFFSDNMEILLKLESSSLPIIHTLSESKSKQLLKSRLTSNPRVIAPHTMDMRWDLVILPILLTCSPGNSYYQLSLENMLQSSIAHITHETMIKINVPRPLLCRFRQKALILLFKNVPQLILIIMPNLENTVLNHILTNSIQKKILIYILQVKEGQGRESNQRNKTKKKNRNAKKNTLRNSLKYHCCHQ